MAKKTRVRQLEGRVISKATIWHGSGGIGDPRDESPSFSIETIDGHEFLFQIKQNKIITEGVLTFADATHDSEILIERDFPEAATE